MDNKGQHYNPFLFLLFSPFCVRRLACRPSEIEKRLGMRAEGSPHADACTDAAAWLANQSDRERMDPFLV